MGKIIWTQTALEDLAGISAYIARDSQYYAEKFEDDAFLAVERLEAFPESGRIVPEWNNPSIREVLLSSYRIVYRLLNDRVYIVMVIHGKRLLPNAPS
jgi:addiction module RelE/StbE family toxin